MFGYRKARRIVSNTTQVFTEAVPQAPPGLTNEQATAVMTYDGVDHTLGLANVISTFRKQTVNCLTIVFTNVLMLTPFSKIRKSSRTPLRT